MVGTLTLILGGVRSGKSRFAEQLATSLSKHDSQELARVLYVATAQAYDDEMKRRIVVHQQSRPNTWQTLEVERNVGEQLQQRCDLEPIVLLDCLTLLTSNVACSVDMERKKSDWFAEMQRETMAEVDALIQLSKTRPCHLIIVSGEVGMGIVPESPLGRAFRDLLGWANQRLGEAACASYVMIAGFPIRLNQLGTTVEQAAEELRRKGQ
jgi:adenosylcobinamide kinase / adenosylcobinamide-phosphate guanylyltransferase